jgi:anti-sigma factor (TIGR02949 family)
MENRKLSCEQATKLFFAYLDRALKGEDLDAIEDHLSACLDCCEKLDFGRKLDGFVKERLGDATLPNGLEARIRSALDGRSTRTQGET